MGSKPHPQTQQLPFTISCAFNNRPFLNIYFRILRLLTNAVRKSNLIESLILQPASYIGYYSGGKNVCVVYNLGMRIGGQSALCNGDVRILRDCGGLACAGRL